MMSLSQLCDKNPLLALKMQSSEPAPLKPCHWTYTLDGIDVLFAYGAGDGALYADIKPWLNEKKEHHLIWIAKGLNDAWGFAGLDDSQVTHCTLEELEVLKIAVWKTALLKAGWAVPEEAGAPREMIDAMRSGIQLLLFKARDFGKKELFNVLENLGDKCIAPMKQLAGKPAIICGSGPSLNPKELAALQDKVYVFAGGSALGKLYEKGIRPHFGAGVDSDPGPLNTGDDVPFFYTDRFCAKVLKKVTGPKLWVRATDELPIEEWILDQLELDVPKFDLGWSVGCASAAIAAEMGCDPIVFYGMDLVDQNDPIETVDKWGEKTRSRQDLIMSANWLKELIKRYPDRRWIDATPSGLEIQGAEKQSLDNLVFEKLDLEPITFQKYRMTLEPIMQKVLKSFENSKKLCMEETPAAVYELECEIFYQHHLKPLWQLWKPVLFKEGNEKMQAMLFYKRVLKAYE